MAKKAKKTVVRREYTKADVKELRAHSKAKTPVVKIAKLTKRSVGSLRQKALKLGIQAGSSALESEASRGAVQQGFLDQGAIADHLRARRSCRYEGIERSLRLQLGDRVSG